MNTLTIILSATLLCLSWGAFISPRPETELYLIRLRIELLTRQLHDACPHLVNHGLFLGKRSADQHQQTMEMEREIHNHILHLLNRCFQEQVTTNPRTTTTQTTSTETTSTEPTSTETTSTETTSTEITSTETTSTETTSTETTSTETTSTETTSTPSTTTQMTTTPLWWCWWTTNSRVTTSTQMTTPPFWMPTTTNYIPYQCYSARYLRESWRNNYLNTDLRNEDVGELDGGRTWFRFAGAAGNLLKNTCPNNEYSCGSANPYWSDSALPSWVGQTVRITFYERVRSSCTYHTFTGRATRCSMDRGGVVYIMDDEMDGSADTFCGMY